VTRPVFIQGFALASSLGVGREVHAGALAGAAPVVDEARFAPHPVHPLAPIPFAQSIPRREYRQMEDWQRLGVHVAGLAIDDAGLRGRVAEMDLVVAAGGGERDPALDAQILAARPDEPALHRMLMDGLRPTLFLAQLSNLLAGSISIVHNVGGSSRTLMGEEIAGAEVLRIAAARIAAGSSALGLVGGAFLAERPEILLMHAMGGQLHAGPWAPMRARTGFVLGSGAAFLLLGEAPARVRLAHIATDQGPDSGGEARLAALLAAGPALRPGALTLWAGPLHADGMGLALGDALGHAVEAAFPLALAIGALAVEAGAPQVRVAMRGSWRGEAVATLEAA
jgi:3-oxoacyl-[acyl-carrier-protein] synthase II